MEDSDTPMGVAFSWTERQLCLLKVTANIIRFNCRARILAEKKMEEALRMVVIDFPTTDDQCPLRGSDPLTSLGQVCSSLIASARTAESGAE